MSEYESWGRYPKADHSVVEVEWLSDAIPFESSEGPFLPYGQGRSYGDSCLNDGGTLLLTKRINRVISFDSETGLLTCEAGMTLAEILDFAVHRGWFLPVTPGTKFVSVGGAIANDVHGKNHHGAGTFGCHVRRFELLRSDGQKMLCSPEENKDYYSATIGGLGLTGLITWVELQLKKVSGPFIDMDSVKFKGLDEFFEISSESDTGFEYTVAWLDCVSSGDNFARGIFMRGNHSKETASRAKCKAKKEIAVVPFNFPSFALNKWSIQAFNTCYYNKQLQKQKKAKVHYDPFFYPLDMVGDWNRIYGKRGLMQYQCVVPDSEDHEAISRILKIIVKSGKASFLAVLKEFADYESPGMLSFPRKGVTLCLDFPFEGESTLKLFKTLEDIVVETGGRMYPSKDACMAAESFKTFYPNWKEFSKFIDPKFSSSFWRRVTQESVAD